jgi:hypothetical protein
LIVFSSIHFTLFAQQSFDPGYIVKHDQDTLKGFIQVTLEKDLSHSIKFKKEDSSETMEYKPVDLFGFGLGKEVYLSMKFLNTAKDTVMENAFVKLLVKGECSLFSYTPDDRNFFILQKDSTVYFLYDRVTGSSGEIKQEGNYLNYLNLISAFCDKLANAYERVGYNERAMTDFVLKVDNCSTGNSAVSYYQKQKTLVQAFAFIGGFPVSSMSQFTANFTLNFSLPRVNKNTSFNIGINYSNTAKSSSDISTGNEILPITNHYSTISLPLTIQYNFTASIIQPYIYAGFSASVYNETTDYPGYGLETTFPQNFLLGLVAGLGVQVRVASKLFIRADWAYNLVLQNPAIGIAYRF